MELNIFLQSVGDIVDIVSVQNVSVFGLLLLIVILLIWHITRIEKKHEKEKEALNQKIVLAQKKLDDEYQKSNDEIKSIIEKYYTISTKVLETLK